MSQQRTAAQDLIDRVADPIELHEHRSQTRLTQLLGIAGLRGQPDSLLALGRLDFGRVFSQREAGQFHPSGLEVLERGYETRLARVLADAARACEGEVLHPQVNLDAEMIYREHYERLGLDFPRERIFYYRVD